MLNSTGTALRTLSTAPEPANEQVLYPWLYLGSDGRVFRAGPLTPSRWLDTTGTGAWGATTKPHFNGAAIPYRDFGAAVMYEPDKVLMTGGGQYPGPTNTSVRRSEMKLIKFTSLVLTLLLVATSATAQKSAKHRHGHAGSPASKNETKPVPIPKLTIPDVEVLDQQGQKQKFYTDLVKDKIVVINFVFTTCKAICPLLGTNFTKLQTELGARLNKDVFLISISTDPETDSPERLKAWGEKFKAKDGWTFVTGSKEQLTTLLQVFTGDGPRTGYHIPSLYVVNGSKNTHRPAYGFESAENVIKLIDELEK